MTAQIPDKITDLAYEAIEALRSALDQAIYPISVACGAKRHDLIHFPIANNATDFNDLLNGRLKELPPDTLALLRTFKTYRGGNDAIWGLNRIRRQASHRLIVPVGTASGGMMANDMTITSTNLKIRMPVWDRQKDEMTFLIASPGTELSYNFKVSFFIAFGPVEGLEGYPVIDTLVGIEREVERIVIDIESVAKRTGLI
jgi:hypothetical protein